MFADTKPTVFLATMPDDIGLPTIHVDLRQRPHQVWQVMSYFDRYDPYETDTMLDFIWWVIARKIPCYIPEKPWWNVGNSLARSRFAALCSLFQEGEKQGIGSTFTPKKWVQREGEGLQVEETETERVIFIIPKKKKK